MTRDELEKRLNIAITIARTGGDSTLPYFHREPEIALELRQKDDQTPVTAADHRAEQVIRECLAGLCHDVCHDDGVLGEEFGEHKGHSGLRWILDPIDGTQSFIRGVPLYGSLVALQEEGEASAMLGVAYFPALGEMMFAARGLGAWWVPRVGAPGGERAAAQRTQVTTIGTLQDATFCYTSVQGFDRSGHSAFFDALRGCVSHDRGFGDCFGHMLVATGRADLHVDPIMKIWDCAALAPIVEEAGGRFTDFKGHHTINGGNAISSNGLVHDATLALIAANAKEATAR